MWGMSVCMCGGEGVCVVWAVSVCMCEGEGVCTYMYMCVSVV